MPSVEDFNLPPPRSHDKLEDLIWDLHRRIWSDQDAQRVGRSGQKQHGLDIVGRPDGGAELAGVQVKLRTSRLTEFELRNEVIEGFAVPATTSDVHCGNDRPERCAAPGDRPRHHARPFREGPVSCVGVGLARGRTTMLDYPNLVRKHYAGLFPLDQQDAAPTPRLELRDVPCSRARA